MAIAGSWSPTISRCRAQRSRSRERLPPRRHDPAGSRRGDGARARPPRIAARRAGRAAARLRGRHARARAPRRGLWPKLVLRGVGRARGAVLRRRSRRGPPAAARQVSRIAVDVLLALAVAVELGCCLGVLTMPGALARLHYAAAATLVAPTLVAAAVAIEEHLTQPTLNAVVVALLLTTLGPVLATVTARLIGLEPGLEGDGDP